MAVITGGGQGIGLSTAKVLGRSGIGVFLVDKDPERLSRAIEELKSEGMKADGKAADVTDLAAMDGVAQEVKKVHGSLDIWVNNAGLARHQKMEEIDNRSVDLVIDVNLKGTIYGSRAAFNVMERGGYILNVISTASLRGIPTESVYCSAKWGVRGFTQALQEEAAPKGIRVTALLPGGVKTAFWSDARESETDMSDFLDPEDVGKAILQCINQPESVVTRELVLRTMKDTDFSYSG